MACNICQGMMFTLIMVSCHWVNIFVAGCWWARSCKGYDVPKESLGQINMEVNVSLPPDAIYNIVIDIDNKRFFKNIQEVLSIKVLLDEGSRQVVKLDKLLYDVIIYTIYTMLILFLMILR